jgi:hypothetical protein
MEKRWNATVWMNSTEPVVDVSEGHVVFEDDKAVVLMHNPQSEFRWTSSRAKGEVFLTESDARGEAIRQLVELRVRLVSKIDTLIEKHRGLQGVESVG